MEKQQQEETMEPCDSMTTVIMKDLAMEYPDPPPSYKTAGRSSSTAVQITKIIATAGIIIATLISFALICSAWITAGSCSGLTNQPMPESLLAPQLLQSALLKSMNDLESAEKKLEAKEKNVSSEEDSGEGQERSADDQGVDDTVTILNIPIPFKEIFETAGDHQRIPLSCFFEKKSSGGIDENGRTLPNLFALNVSSDSRCLRFTGDNISICCDLKDEKVMKDPLPSLTPPAPLTSSSSSVSSASEPLQVIGPIPLAQRSPSLPEILSELWTGVNGGMSGMDQQMIPFLQGNDEPHFKIQVQEVGLPLFLPQGQDAGGALGGGALSQLFNLQRPTSPRIKLSHHTFSESENPDDMPLLVQTSELRQRALHQPIPLVPRHHFPHVIRPRSAETQGSEIF